MKNATFTCVMMAMLALMAITVMGVHSPWGEKILNVFAPAPVVSALESHDDNDPCVILLTSNQPAICPDGFHVQAYIDFDGFHRYVIKHYCVCDDNHSQGALVLPLVITVSAPAQ